MLQGTSFSMGQDIQCLPNFMQFCSGEGGVDGRQTPWGLGDRMRKLESEVAAVVKRPAERDEVLVDERSSVGTDF